MIFKKTSRRGARAIANRLSRKRSSGLTMVELMVVVGLLGVLLAIAAPSMRGMIEVHRLRGINAQLLTDLQFARSEAISRGAVVRMDFKENATSSCYSISTGTGNSFCNCELGVGRACLNSAGSSELRTVIVSKSTGTTLKIPTGVLSRFGFEPVHGALVNLAIDFFGQPVPLVMVEPTIDTKRRFRIEITYSGSPVVCKPSGSRMEVGDCPPD